MTETAKEPNPSLPWLAAPLRRALETQGAHALLVHGPSSADPYEFALVLAQGWLCESATLSVGERPCGLCASCRLVQARSHPDLLVLVPQALRESLGLSSDGAGDESEERSAKKKPSKEIRVDEIRVAVAFALTTSARGRAKVVVVHPAERMNAIASNAFLKTLEEPPGLARFLLCSAAPDALLPTIRSRCLAFELRLPETAAAVDWLARQGAAEPDVILAGAGGEPQEAAARLAFGIDAAAWRTLPRRIAAGDAAALRGWPLPWAVDALQKICHDSACLAAAAPPRYFPTASMPPPGSLDALLHYSRVLTRFAADGEHPWHADLSTEALVAQGREALQTPRSPRRGAQDE